MAGGDPGSGPVRPAVGACATGRACARAGTCAGVGSAGPPGRAVCVMGVHTSPFARPCRPRQYFRNRVSV